MSTPKALIFTSDAIVLNKNKQGSLEKWLVLGPEQEIDKGSFYENRKRGCSQEREACIDGRMSQKSTETFPMAKAETT